MANSVFLEAEFSLLLISSLLVPIGIYIFLLKTKSIARATVLGFASLLIALSALDVYLLQAIAQMAKVSMSSLDDQVFLSELSIALYLLPAVFAGIGVNLISHILIDHLGKAENKFIHSRRHTDRRDHASGSALHSR